jgi:hypothetical protein
VTYSYDERGLLTRIDDKPNRLFYSKEASKITTYIYADTLLKIKLTTTFIGDTIFRKDSILYDYDEYNRLASVYSLGMLEVSSYNNPKLSFNSDLVKKRYYSSSRRVDDTLLVPTVEKYGKTFYLNNFDIYSNPNANRYRKCQTVKPNKQQAFCKSELQRVRTQGDSLRQIITVRTGYNDYGYRNDLVFSDSTYVYSGDHDIKTVVTEKLMNGRVIERNTFEYDDTYRSMCINSTTLIYTYNSVGLVTSIKSKTAIYLYAKQPPSWLENTVHYYYTFYR